MALAADTLITGDYFVSKIKLPSYSVADSSGISLSTRAFGELLKFLVDLLPPGPSHETSLLTELVPCVA
jgi:hypothetical protein